MRKIALTLRASGIAAPLAYERIKDFAQYPEHVEEVRSVGVVPQGDGDSHCHTIWEVVFRNGPLKWTEVDYFQHDQLRIVFEQLDGDFDVFRGQWAVQPIDNDTCEITFQAAFDFGIASLAGVLEPIASRVLKEGIAIIIYRLVGGGEVIDDPELAAGVERRLATAVVNNAAISRLDPDLRSA